MYIFCLMDFHLNTNSFGSISIQAIWHIVLWLHCVKEWKKKYLFRTKITQCNRQQLWDKQTHWLRVLSYNATRKKLQMDICPRRNVTLSKCTFLKRSIRWCHSYINSWSHLVPTVFYRRRNTLKINLFILYYFLEFFLHYKINSYNISFMHLCYGYQTTEV